MLRYRCGHMSGNTVVPEAGAPMSLYFGQYACDIVVTLGDVLPLVVVLLVVSAIQSGVHG